RLGPGGTPRTWPMLDPVQMPAQRQRRPMREGLGARQAAQPSGDPGAVFFRKIPRMLHAAARRHCQHDFTAYGVDAQRVAARLSMPAHADRMNLAVNLDRNRRRFAAATVEQGSEGYGQHQFVGPRCVITPENTGSTLTNNFQQGCQHGTRAVVRQREVGNTRRNLGAETRTVEDAVMADGRLHVVYLVLLRNVDAQRMRGLSLPDAGYIVVLALDRHQCNAPDRRWIHPTATMCHLAFRQCMADEHRLHGLQVEFRREIHHREIFIVEFAMLLRRIAVALDE